MSDHRHAGRNVAALGVAASAVLAVINIVVGMITASTSVFATGVEFAGDVLASSIVLIGILVAAKPADANHPYGHGRVETLAAFVVALVLVAGGIGISWNSLHAVGEVHPPPGSLAIAALGVAIAVRTVMASLKFRVGRRLGSASLVADAWNDTVDILAAAVALTAVGLATFGHSRFLAADHYGGFAVGVIMVLTGLRVLKQASLELMDTMPAPGMIEHVRTTALSVPGVEGVDKIHARKTGFQYHVDLHIQVDPALTVQEGHGVGGRVRSAAREQIGWVADVLVHVEPAPRA